nr:PQQ-binding-like beta-propeller repeat protein [Candidatus Njordarchaeota archaeon]
MRGKSIVLNQSGAPSSPRKVIAIFILIMAAIAPLVVVWTGSRGQQTPIIASNQESETTRTLASTSPTLIWTYTTGIVSSSPVVADLMGNGKLEVIFGSWDNRTYCLNGTTGSKLWSYATGKEIASSPVVADLLGNGKLEVIVGSSDNNVYCLNGTTGGKVWSYAIGSNIGSSPVVADLFGNGKLEVLAGSNGGVYCLSGEVVSPSDITPPATVTDLVAGSPTNTSVTLAWTAPGDDGMIGNATGYVVKYSTSGPITDGNWGSATTYTQLWTPAKNGTTETYVITGLNPDTTYWFAVKAYDEASNLGGASNSSNATTTTQGGGSRTQVIAVSIMAGVVVLVLLAALLYVRRRGGATGAPAERARALRRDKAASRQQETVVKEKSVVSLPSSNRCPYCGVSFKLPEASFCWNCGASLERSPEGTVVRTEGKKASTPELPCMICKLEVKKSDGVAWCPYCGNIGHKNHMLEWLHTHNSCPMCQRHLNEEILIEQL